MSPGAKEALLAVVLFAIVLAVIASGVGLYLVGGAAAIIGWLVSLPWFYVLLGVIAVAVTINTIVMVSR